MSLLSRINSTRTKLNAKLDAVLMRLLTSETVTRKVTVKREVPDLDPDVDMWGFGPADLWVGYGGDRFMYDALSDDKRALKDGIGTDEGILTVAPSHYASLKPAPVAPIISEHVGLAFPATHLDHVLQAAVLDMEYLPEHGVYCTIASPHAVSYGRIVDILTMEEISAVEACARKHERSARPYVTVEVMGKHVIPYYDLPGDGL